MYGPAVLVRKDTGHGVGGKIAKDKKRVFEPRIELGTFCVLGRRDNQLHHPNATGNFTSTTVYLYYSCSCNSVGRVLVL